MAFSHALATNNYGPAHIIVSASAANGTHTTITSAMADAVSGDTIFIRNGTYTENVVITAGVNLCAFPCDAGLNCNSNTSANVIIIGKLSYSGSGATTISGIQLQTNSDNFLAVSGSSVSTVNLIGCFLNVLNNTGISYTTSNASSSVNISYCQGNIGTTGIALFSSTSTGQLNFQYTDIENSGGSSTASTTNATTLNIERCLLKLQITTTAASGSFTYSEINGANNTCLTTVTSGTVQLNKCLLNGGTASAVSIGVSTTVNLYDCTINSSNTNAVTGAGTLLYSNMTFSNTSSVINTTTQTPNFVNLGKYKASGQPAFLAFLGSVASNVTGDGTVYTLGSTVALTIVFDKASNFNTNGTFTAPVTGIYELGVICLVNGGTSITGGDLIIVTTARSYRATMYNNGTGVTNIAATNVTLADMTAGDTATFTVATNDTGGKIDDLPGSASPYLIYVWGRLVQ